ncbi:MAG: DUF1285 domain-containing protein [Hyphomicrobiales bacterium]|nr:DUF1285 domain-containing protein [Hyphomicrobiales bacterium]MDE2114956.1 DUF1285 domain-containing protein [Hyphomicrobiales bacterium]
MADSSNTEISKSPCSKLVAQPLGALADNVSRASKVAKDNKKSWDPPFCGYIDMRITADGAWHYNGTPISRPAMVRLFASVLRKEADGYRLVTPVEKVGIQVDDAPFVAVEMRVEDAADGQVIHVRTNLDEWIDLGPDHALRFELGTANGLKPYIQVRDDLWALASRPLTHELTSRIEAGSGPNANFYGISSNGRFFKVATIEELEALM